MAPITFPDRESLRALAPSNEVLSSKFTLNNGLRTSLGFAAPRFAAPTMTRSAVKAHTSDEGFGLYLRYAMSGALCCSITHSAVVPIDVVKTRLQTDPGKYKGMFDGFRRIPKEEGAAMLLQGLGPTAVGYFAQGAFKFGFYEFFKKLYGGFAGDKADELRIPIWLAAGGSAEVIADMALCPMEATRIRLVAQPEFAKGLPDCFSRIIKEEGLMGLYKGLPPILLKQVPYTMAKFAVFEFASEKIYNILEAQGRPKASLSDGTKLVVSLGGGVIAGVVAAIISQPADTVLSKINQVKTDGGMVSAIAQICRNLGMSGLFLGVGARCFMVGTLTAGQFFIYDYCKMLFGVSPKQLAAKKAAQQS